jgi:hypothetical protein
VIENRLGEIEGKIGNIIRTIMSIPEPHVERASEAHILLTIFSVYQYVRTDKALSLVKEAVAKNFSIIKEHAKSELMPRLAAAANGQLTEEELAVFYNNMTVNLENPHSFLFESANKMLGSVFNLKMKLLKNETKTPFLIGDNPLIYMNEGESDCFYRMLLPLTPNLLLVFYDDKQYKIGAKNTNWYGVSNESDVFYLNVLQYLNCNTNIYFSSEMPLNDLMIFARSFKKYRFSENTTFAMHNNRLFLRTNRPIVKHNFSFTKKINLAVR